MTKGEKPNGALRCSPKCTFDTKGCRSGDGGPGSGGTGGVSTGGTGGGGTGGMSAQGL